MEKAKYYQPEVEEFHEGFICEIESSWGWQEGTFPTILKSDTLSGALVQKVGYWESLPNLITSLRVKYLDREDIESLEFKKRLNNQWIGWSDYILETINGNCPYFLTCTLHVPRMDDMYKIYVHRHLNDETNDIENQLNNGESELVFKGKIKNKSELLKLLKLLIIK